MKRPVSGRDAVYAPKVIDVLEAQDKKETGNEKVSTVTAKRRKKFLSTEIDHRAGWAIATAGTACWMKPAKDSWNSECLADPG